MEMIVLPLKRDGNAPNWHFENFIFYAQKEKIYQVMETRAASRSILLFQNKQ